MVTHSAQELSRLHRPRGSRQTTPGDNAQAADQVYLVTRQFGVAVPAEHDRPRPAAPSCRSDGSRQRS
jgi:hypothetical protein